MARSRQVEGAAVGIFQKDATLAAHPPRIWGLINSNCYLRTSRAALAMTATGGSLLSI